MNILVAEPLSPAGLAILLKNTDWNVIVSNPKEYDQHLADADALVVRSAVKVTREVLAKAPNLRASGRAGGGGGPCRRSYWLGRALFGAAGASPPPAGGASTCRL